MKIYDNKKIIIYACILAIGVVIVIAACLGYVDDFWSGFGGGIAGVAIVRLILGIRYKKDPEYARKTDIANTDERMLYVSGNKT